MGVVLLIMPQRNKKNTVISNHNNILCPKGYRPKILVVDVVYCFNLVSANEFI